MKHPIPIKILDQHLVALGKTGSGKSYMLRGLIEMLLDAGKRVCVIDPKGDHWGIKSSADGKQAGYEVVTFGDFTNPSASDVSINARAGKEIGELITADNRPTVIGFRGWMPGDRTRFWIDFASTLFNHNRSPLWLVIDEIHNFAPQGKVLDPEAGKCLHWTNRIASEGRGIGIRLLMASQRPQKVHKDTLTCAETLVAMRVIHNLDRAAVKDWLDGSGDMEKTRMILNSLANIKRGEAFVWSPEAGYFERVTFPKIRTFDSYHLPPENETQQKPKGWAEVNLDAVRERLAKIQEEAKANDPAELRKEIARLKAESRSVSLSQPTIAVTRELDELHKKYDALLTLVKNYQNAVEEFFKPLQAYLSRPLPRVSLDGLAVSHRQFKPRATETPMQYASRKKYPASAVAGTLEAYDQRTLTTIAMLHARGITPNRESVARWMGIHPNGGRYLASLARLRDQGMLDRFEITALGSGCIAGYETGLEATRQALNAYNRNIFDTIQRAGKPLSREELAERLGIHPNGGRFLSAIAWLRDMGIIPERGPIEVTEGALR